MYERFVDQAQNPVLGLVAYGLYKKAKREWAQDFQARHKRKPNDSELSEYVMTWTAEKFDAQHARATQILVSYADSVVADVRPAIVEEALKGKFSSDIFRSMLANFIYTIVLIAVALVLKYSGVDVAGIFSAVK